MRASGTAYCHKARGIYLASLEERLDTSSAAGEPVFHVFGAIAHCAPRLICERTRDGIAAAMRNEDLAPLPQSCEQTFR